MNPGIDRAPVPHSSAYLRIKMILDCILILLVIWIASGNWLAAQARSANRAEIVGQSGFVHQAERYPAWASDPGIASSEQTPALIDNNTLAAIIAAENAALTPPIYFTDLPLIRP